MYKNAYRTIVRRPEGMRPLTRPKNRGEDNIKMNIKIECVNVD
jgi:hypothetical protein